METIVNSAWEGLPEVKSFSQGFLLDGYFDSDNNGFYCVFYLPESGGKLVKWLDPNGRKVVRYYGHLSNINGYHAIHHQKWDALEFKMRDMTDIIVHTPTQTAVPFINALIAENFKIPELQYYTYRQVVPGAWYAVQNNRLVIINLDHSKANEIKQKLLGETKDLVDLALENFPILDSPVPDIPRLAFDIEVGSPRETFAIPEKAEFPVISVAMSSSKGYDKVLVLGENDLNETEISTMIENHSFNPINSVEFFSNEKDLLVRTFQLLMSSPIVLSFNGNSFDIPYLMNRAKKLGIQYIPIKQHRRFPLEYHISGTIHIDLMSFFRNQAIRLYAFGGKYSTWNLDDIAEALLGTKKIEHDLWFDEMSIADLIVYNLVDSRITLDLTRFSNNLAWTLIVMIMRLGKIPITVLTQFSISNWIRQWLTYDHARRGYLVPEKDRILAVKGNFESSAGIEGKGFAGAIVLDPVSGIWRNVIVIDFASLYPSTTKRRNISYETVRCEGKGHEWCKENTVPGLSHWVCIRYTGIMSSLVGFVRDLRVRWYKSLKKKSKGEKKIFYDMVQASLKVFINASYGVFGASDFDLFCPPVAESTTAFARDALLTLHGLAEEEGIPVLYGDTDSLFLYQPPKDVLDRIMFRMLIRHGMELGIDYEFKFLYLTDRKKNYFGFTTNGKIIIKGLQGKKSNTPAFIRKIFKNVLTTFSEMIDDHGLSEIKRHVIEMVTPVFTKLKKRTMPIEELKTQYTLNKDFDKIKQKTPAVMIAFLHFYKKTPRSHEITKGSIFFGVKVKPFIIQIKENPFPHLDFPLEKPIEITFSDIEFVSTDMIDWNYYLQSLKKTLEPIFAPLQISWDRDILGQKSLMEFVL